jgi:hypothetical protein
MMVFTGQPNPETNILKNLYKQFEEKVVFLNKEDQINPFV